MRRNIDSPPLSQRAGETAAQASASVADALSAMREARERMETQLQVTERSRNRLPPLHSNRAGWMARLELWIKRRFQRATHWYVWEQLDFNAATNRALHEALTMLSLYEALMTSLQNQLRDAGSRTEHQLPTVNQQMPIEDNGGGTPDARLATILNERIEELRNEQRTHVEQLLEEQRVGFKQLTLQLTEQTVATDRAARIAQLRLDNLEKQIEELRRP